MTIRVSKKTFPLARVYTLLEPGPVVLITTARRRALNIMAQSWHTMMEFEPPLVGCIISGRNHTFDTLIATRECVINIPTVELVKQVVSIGNCSGNKVDKFALTGLTPLEASQVKAPLIAECFANLECKLVNTRLVNSYNFFILGVIKAWTNPAIKMPKTLHHRGNGEFMIGGILIKLPSRMK